MTKALITGITGQTGSYMAEYLLKLGYVVHGLNRRKSSDNFKNISHILDDIKLVDGDLTDAPSINKIIELGQYDEIYNLAAQSHVAVSFNQPAETLDVNAKGVLNLLEATEWFSPFTKVYQASTSELFGSSKPPQNEETVFHPRSPYGVAKLAAFWYIVNYRESYNIKAANGILFNHESPRRGDTFVTKKITNWVKQYREDNTIKPLELGNLSAKRDWSHARDMVDAIYRICNQDKFRKDWTPESKFKDYCCGSGSAYDIRFFLIRALMIGLDLQFFSQRFEFMGSGMDEAIYDKTTKRNIVTTVKSYYRPAEVDYLLCDPTKLKTELGWIPKYDLNKLIEDMLAN